MKKLLSLSFVFAGLGLGYYLLRKGKTNKEMVEEDTFMSEAEALQQYGTPQGVIDVGLDEEEKEEKELKEFVEQAKLIGDTVKLKKIKTPPFTSLAKYYQHLHRHYETTQVTVTNHSALPKEIKLWGGHQEEPISISSPEEVNNHALKTSISLHTTGLSAPQQMVINPANGYAYFTHQLDNAVSIMTLRGEIINVISLEPHQYPGLNSPFGIVVNTTTASPNYGKVYVAGSVSNTISIINLAHEVEDTLTVGNRPIMMSYNPNNEKLYVSNLADNTVSIIDTRAVLLKGTLPVGDKPYGIAINPMNNEALVCGSGDDTFTVIDEHENILTTALNIGENPTDAIYYQDQIVVVGNGGNELFTYDPTTYHQIGSLEVGLFPFAIMYNPNNNMLYVGNTADNTISIVNEALEVVATLDVPYVNTSIAMYDNEIFVPNPLENTLHVVGYHTESSSVTYNDSLLEDTRTFQHEPAKVKHVKMISSTEELPKLLTVEEKNSTGKVNVDSHSITAYRSPQHALPVAELFGLAHTIIDGQHSWRLTLAPQQSLTILVYYQQLNAIALLP